MIIGIAGVAGSGKNTVGDILAREFGFAQIALADPIKRAAREWLALSERQLFGPSEERNRGDGRYPLTEDARNWVDIFSRTIREKDEVFYRELVDAFGANTGEDPAEHFLTPRKVLQTLGTEGVRAAWPDTWVDKGIRDAVELLTASWVDYHPLRGVYRNTFRSPDETYAGVAITDVRFRNEVKAIRAARGHVVRVTRPGAGLKGGAAAHQSETELSTMFAVEFDSHLENDGTLEGLADKVRALARALV